MLLDYLEEFGLDAPRWTAVDAEDPGEDFRVAVAEKVPEGRGALVDRVAVDHLIIFTIQITCLFNAWKSK